MDGQDVRKDLPGGADAVTGEKGLDILASAPTPPAADVGATAFSNAVRLSLREWYVVGVFAILLIVFAPILWKQHEKISLEPDHRMPHELSNDYWLYQRYAELAAARYDTLLIGDSVVWGEYATPQETLSHYLNEQSGEERFGNLGLDGAHPLALSGLVQHHTGGFSGKNVVLLCNPLWMSSPRADLQENKAAEFNHPRLVPQFRPWIPSYKAEINTRLGIVVEQHSEVIGWTTHLQQAYYDQKDIPEWTLEHPYDNPLSPLTRDLPQPDGARRHPAQPWDKSGITKQDYPWVDLRTSLQWRAFRDVVETLRQRGNRVFVVVGPFNEHLLKPRSLQDYQQVKAAITSWLVAEQVPHLVPPPLPSDQYGDASHPLADGYAALARQLLAEPSFPKGRRE